MGGALGLALQSFYHDLLHLRIANLSRRSWTRLIIERISPAFKETLAHGADGLIAGVQPLLNLPSKSTAAQHQHNPRAKGRAASLPFPSRQPLQLHPLFWGPSNR